ncbi:hypothetical protein DI272_18980 [Streptomyces sp. Act143]|uniref:hypothetical protein n=1 Tax=Streptomyces sp. Act143 TaxID=2200760 RepID=UPI000D672432|nr:hypothetical protein [Streptomyces sp. Act143]PWI16018.1 hypothetical protein DI272_18980 [Streptomyces sp. Act143]
MATTDSPPQSGYQPSAQLRQHLDDWNKAVAAEPTARKALEDGIAVELTENRQLNLPTLAEHMPWTAENIRLLMAGRGVPPRERHRKEEGDPPVYTPSDRLRDQLAGWHLAVDDEKKARAALEKAIADELRANPDLTNAEIAAHLPWAQEQIRLIARAHNVPRRRKRGSEHKLIEANGKPKSVVVPYDWYVQQPGADPSIVKR